MRYLLWLVSLPLRLFDAVATRFVDAPQDETVSREDAERLRDLELEAIADTPPPPAA